MKLSEVTCSKSLCHIMSVIVQNEKWMHGKNVILTGGARPSQIAKELKITKQVASKQCKKLLKAGVIKAVVDEKRKKVYGMNYDKLIGRYREGLEFKVKEGKKRDIVEKINSAFSDKRIKEFLTTYFHGELAGVHKMAPDWDLFMIESVLGDVLLKIAINILNPLITSGRINKMSKKDKEFVNNLSLLVALTHHMADTSDVAITYVSEVLNVEGEKVIWDVRKNIEEFVFGKKLR